MREGYDHYVERLDDIDRIDSCKADRHNALSKRTKMSGTRKRLITSTSNAAGPGLDHGAASYRKQVYDSSFAPLLEAPQGFRQRGRPLRANPTYFKVHRNRISPKTLDFYDLPWEWDEDPDYIVISREIDPLELEVLFQHTHRLRTRSDRRASPVIEKIIENDPRSSKRGSPEIVYVRRGRSRSRASFRHTSPPRRSCSPTSVSDGGEVESGAREESSIDERRRDVEMARIELQKARELYEKQRRGYEEHTSEADEDETDEHDDESISDLDIEISFLPSTASGSSTAIDMLSNASDAAGIHTDIIRDNKVRHNQLQERYITSTRWLGNTFDESDLGAEVKITSPPPMRSHQTAMLRWTHLERAMPSFEEFQAVVEATLSDSQAHKRHVRDLLRKLQRNNEQQRQQGREMKAFCEADVDIEERGVSDPQVRSVCVLSIPFFSLEKSVVPQIRSLPSNAPQHPARPLLQTHSRVLSEAREQSQAVTALVSTPQGYFLHVSYMWGLVVNEDTLITCSRPPLTVLAKELQFINDSGDKAAQPSMVLRSGRSQRWRIPESVVSSKPAFLSMLSDNISDLIPGSPFAQLNYCGRAVDFADWEATMADILKSHSEVVLTNSASRHSRSRRLGRSGYATQLAALQRLSPRKSSNAAEGDASSAKASQDAFAGAQTLNTLPALQVYFHSVGGTSKALADLAEGLHRSLAAAKQSLMRTTYLKCKEASLKDIQAWIGQQPPSAQESRGLSKGARTLAQHKLTFARMSEYVFSFFWPKNFDHTLTRKFWGSVKTLLEGETFYGNGNLDQRRDIDAMHDFLQQLCDRVMEFAVPFAIAFSGHEHDLAKLPEQFYRAWLHLVCAYTIAAKARLDDRHHRNWSETIECLRKVNEMLSDGERLLTLRLRKTDVEEFEVCTSRGIVALMLDCVTRDLMNGKPDVAQTYNDYCRQLEARMVAEPLTRSHQETLRGLLQEIEAIMAVLTQQLDVVNSFESSIRDLDCDTRLADLPMLRTSRQDLVLRQCKANIDARLDQFEALQGRVNELGEWHMSEIDTNKDRQEAAIMVFTIVTIVFLPLSFVSSVLGMNTEDIRDMTQGQWVYWAAAVPLTVLVVGASLWFAGAFDNIGFWFSRSMKRASTVYKPLPASMTMRAERMEPLATKQAQMVYPGPRRRTTYPIKRSYV